MSANLRILQNYYMDNFPTEVPKKAAQGFIVTAAINLCSGFSTHVALLGGAIAATATIIEAVTRPIIRSVFRGNRFVAKFIQLAVPQAIALGLATSVVPWIGVSYKMSSYLLPLIAWISLNDRFYESNVGIVAVL